MRTSTSLLIGLLSIVWRAQCAPKIPKATAIADASSHAASVAAAVPPKWYCETICAGGCGGSPYYDSHKQVCRCTINEHIDDGDMELIQRTAKIINMKIKFIDLRKSVKKRDADESLGSSEEADITTVEYSEDEPTTKAYIPPRKIFGFEPLKPFKPFFGDLTRANQHQPLPQAQGMDVAPQDAILGQLDPTLYDSEPHHNIYAAPPAPGKSLFGGGHLLGPAPASFPAPLPTHLAPALTRSLLMNVRDKLDSLLLHTQQYPYQPAITAHETESMRNTLKQITQVNVNVRPVGTTFGYFFNNLVNQLAPILRAEAPNSTFVDQKDQSVTSATVSAIGRGDDEASKVASKVDHHEKKIHKSKSGKAVELGKKTSTKGTTTDAPFIPVEVTTLLSLLPVFDIKPTTPSTTTKVHEIYQELKESHDFLPIEHLFSTEEEKEKEEGSTPKFLPHEEDDEVVGEDYLYDDEPHMDK